MAMLCELIDKYFVETLLCSGGVKRALEIYIERVDYMIKRKVVTTMLLLAL